LYLATSGAKSYVIFLLHDPAISHKGDEISRLISLSFRDLTRNRQTDRQMTDDIRDGRFIRLLHLQCASL